jgi:hypothetical protein
MNVEPKKERERERERRESWIPSTKYGVPNNKIVPNIQFYAIYAFYAFYAEGKVKINTSSDFNI